VLMSTLIAFVLDTGVALHVWPVLLIEAWIGKRSQECAGARPLVGAGGHALRQFGRARVAVEFVTSGGSRLVVYIEGVIADVRLPILSVARLFNRGLSVHLNAPPKQLQLMVPTGEDIAVHIERDTFVVRGRLHETGVCTVEILPVTAVESLLWLAATGGLGSICCASGCSTSGQRAPGPCAASPCATNWPFGARSRTVSIKPGAPQRSCCAEAGFPQRAGTAAPRCHTCALPGLVQCVRAGEESRCCAPCVLTRRANRTVSG
jgi:hypothetical protein